MGDHLRTAETRKQAGRFEDEKFVRFHRRVLAAACASEEPGYADWGWTEGERLETRRFNDFRGEAERLLMTRAGDSEASGWEDPRATLFLNEWDGLIEDARYIFVYGFPWDVSEAMQWLWIETFLEHPEYAYRIWNFYNQRVRDFYVKHADRCLLLNINAVPANLERFVFLLGKLGIGSTDLGLAEVVESRKPKNIEGQESWIELALAGTLRSRSPDVELGSRWIQIRKEDPLVGLSLMAWPDAANLLAELDGLADISGDGLWQAKPVRSRLSRPDAADGKPVDLSVITPCYNQGTLLIDAIASTERNAPANCELIIVNDGSREPKTLEILDCLRKAGYFVFDQENAGLSAARNRGISLARGRYVLPLDDDNRIREGFLAEAIKVLDVNPKVGIVYGDRQDFGWYHKTQSVPEFDLFSLLKQNFIDACAVFRKQVWLDCGGYDTELSALEDWELWIHAAEIGWRFHHLPFVAFDYRVRPGSMVSVFDSIEIWEDFCRRIRSKHPELYWNVAVGRIGALKLELESIQSAVAEKSGALERVESELKINNSQLAVNEGEIQELRDQIDALSSRLREREAELSRITNSFGWRLMNRYGQIKYRYLLPIYRLFGRAPAAMSERTPAQKM
jgi:glycosyltransferase involved in cell wall biosynthesis